MKIFLKSLFGRTEPDIFVNLDKLTEIGDVIDFCLFDADANIIRTGLELSNARSLFSSVGKEAIRALLLVSAFAKWTGSDSRFCLVQCGGGSILIWNFGGSFLIVLLKSLSQLSVVRMTVNIFKEMASDSRSCEKYFCESEISAKNVWQNDSELKNLINCVLGNPVKEET